MKITVTPICRHKDTGWNDRGKSFTGRHAIIRAEGVILDGQDVIQRDRRMTRNREAGHPWLAAGQTGAWTSFRVEVEP